MSGISESNSFIFRLRSDERMTLSGGEGGRVKQGQAKGFAQFDEPLSLENIQPAAGDVQMDGGHGSSGAARYYNVET